MLIGLSLRIPIIFFTLTLMMGPLFAVSEGHWDASGSSDEPGVFSPPPPLPAQTPKKSPFFSPIFILTGGVSSTRLNQSQTMFPIDICYYDYTVDDNSTDFLWGAFLGAEVFKVPSWSLIAGVSYYQPSSITNKGTLVQGADIPSQDTYEYRYEIKNQQVLAEAKLAWLGHDYFQPFLTAGIGLSFNQSTDYETTVPPFYEFTPYFYDGSQTNIAYALGAGIDFPLTHYAKIGAAYRFTTFGQNKTGTGQIDNIPISNQLSNSNLYTNQFLLQLTFVPWT